MMSQPGGPARIRRPLLNVESGLKTGSPQHVVLLAIEGRADRRCMLTEPARANVAELAGGPVVGGGGAAPRGLVIFRLASRQGWR